MSEKSKLANKIFGKYGEYLSDTINKKNKILEWIENKKNYSDYLVLNNGTSKFTLVPIKNIDLNKVDLNLNSINNFISNLTTNSNIIQNKLDKIYLSTSTPVSIHSNDGTIKDITIFSKGYTKKISKTLDFVGQNPDNAMAGGYHEQIYAQGNISYCEQSVPAYDVIRANQGMHIICDVTLTIVDSDFNIAELANFETAKKLCVSINSLELSGNSYFKTNRGFIIDNIKLANNAIVTLCQDTGIQLNGKNTSTVISKFNKIELFDDSICEIVSPIIQGNTVSVFNNVYFAIKGGTAEDLQKYNNIDKSEFKDIYINSICGFNNSYSSINNANVGTVTFYDYTNNYIQNSNINIYVNASRSKIQIDEPYINMVSGSFLGYAAYTNTVSSQLINDEIGIFIACSNQYMSISSSIIRTNYIM